MTDTTLTAGDLLCEVTLDYIITSQESQRIALCPRHFRSVMKIDLQDASHQQIRDYTQHPAFQDRVFWYETHNEEILDARINTDIPVPIEEIPESLGELKARHD